MTKRRAPVEGLEGDRRITLDLETSRYLGRALRLVEGDEFVAFDPRSAKEADARIVAVEGGAVVAEVGSLRSAKVLAARKAIWIQALAKGEKCDAIVRDATELGATMIVFADTERSVVRLSPDRAKERVARWERIAREAARQSLRGDAPAISSAPWRKALSEIDATAARFVLDPNAQTKLGPLLAEVAREPSHPVAFAVGAEGGLTTEELEHAEKQGWNRVSIGPVVLRTETMCAALLGALRVFSNT